MSKYYSVVTNVGKKKIARAIVTGEKVHIVEMAIGDGDGDFYNPEESMTKLKNEMWRGEVSYYNVPEGDEKRITIGAVVPANIGGFVIREIGVLDEEGALIAICNTPDTEKASDTDGIINQMDIAVDIIAVDRETISVEIDPNITTATKEDVSKVDEKIKAHIGNKNNPHEVTKEQIELGNVDNTSDENKPISKAQQQALNVLNLQILQSASNHPLTDALLINLVDPQGNANRPAILSKETATGDYPQKCVWGVREVFWHSRRNVAIKITGITEEGDTRVWSNSFVDGLGWTGWQEPITALATHKSGGDHDGRYYTETEVDSKIENLNVRVESCLKSVGDGKAIVAAAITAQGVATATDAAFSVMGANITTAGNARYNTGYSAGVTAADNRANPASNNYKAGYNAGVAAADNRANTSSVNYKTGYNAGVTKGQNDVKNNPGGYGLYTKSQYDANYDKGYKAGVAAGKEGRYVVKTGSFSVSPGSNEARNYQINTGLTTTKAVYFMSDSNDFSVVKISNTECRVWARFGGSAKISWVAYGS